MIDLSDIPQEPGVYIYKDENKKVLYVGKAINLKNRVSSYFNNFDALNPKTKALVSKIHKIDYIKVSNELESLLLEAELIKRYKPKYNIDLKDDKFYKYIKVEKKVENLLTISTSRTNTQAINSKSTKYFGPFPESSSIAIIIQTLRKIFPYKDCSDSKFTRYKKMKRPCLYGFIGVCPAPCQTEEAKKVNNDNVKKITKYLKGDRSKLFDKLKIEMKLASKNQDFEKAAYLRDQINAYEYLTQNKRDIKEYTLNPNLIDDTNSFGVQELIAILEKLEFKFKKIDYRTFRIEIFDISNFQGSNAVGSMVVLTAGVSDKKEYRRFKIRTKDTPDDFSMMKEMLERRFSNHKKNDQPDDKTRWQNPDLILVDGGKGQLSVALDVLNKLNVDIPTIGLAKREEEIVYFKNGSFNLLKLNKEDPALNILIKGRDEAHRFGITYYRKLHQKKMLT